MFIFLRFTSTVAGNGGCIRVSWMEQVEFTNSAPDIVMSSKFEILQRWFAYMSDDWDPDKPICKQLHGPSWCPHA